MVGGRVEWNNIYLNAFPNTVPVKDQIQNVDSWQTRACERSGASHVNDGELRPVRTTTYPKPSKNSLVNGVGGSEVSLSYRLIYHTHFDDRGHPELTEVSARPPLVASGWETTNLLIPLADLVKWKDASMNVIASKSMAIR